MGHLSKQPANESVTSVHALQRIFHHTLAMTCSWPLSSTLLFTLPVETLGVFTNLAKLSTFPKSILSACVALLTTPTSAASFLAFNALVSCDVENCVFDVACPRFCRIASRSFAWSERAWNNRAVFDVAGSCMLTAQVLVSSHTDNVGKGVHVEGFSCGGLHWQVPAVVG